MCMEPKCLDSSWFKEPEEVAPGACHFESGGSSSTAKKKVVRARRRRALSETNPGGLSTKIQGIAARQPSFHLCYQATLPYLVQLTICGCCINNVVAEKKAGSTNKL